jgi:AbrB family looped-hinge helix DNA binding protein
MEKFIWLDVELCFVVICMPNCESDTCRIDAVVTMDVKGQIVLPKDLREKADMRPNDKIAIIACERNGKVCCVMMVKAEKLTDAVTKTINPLIKGLTATEC